MTELTIDTVDINLIDPNPWNPNRQSDAVQRATAESIEEFGFIDPITVRALDGRYQVIDGEHRWRKAVEAGLADVPVIVIHASDKEARRLTLILNETRGEHDVVAVGTLLAQLRNEDVELDELLRGLPYSTTELQHLLSLADEDWERFTGDAPEPPDDPDTARETISFVLDFTTAQHQRFMSKVRRAGPVLGTDDPQVIVKELVKRGFDSL